MFKVKEKDTGKEYIVYNVRHKEFERDIVIYFLIYTEYEKWIYMDSDLFEPIN